ncbi:NDP-hexose 2,3-dehydratase family protein [uncultured Christiangramia sp.]|uniref:NDP-hexose 2,3-dehydratase family protein n=1 Tax=uncultured Christiangramia sp. TaxID=503836 RepID=UPI0026299FF5|nr:NDP-hexose 2,3-dehydratase family protein [uncultured Christiangramia sp.]
MLKSVFELFQSSLQRTPEDESEIVETLKWIENLNDEAKVSIKPTTFSKLDAWSFKNGALVHDSNRFFKVKGIKIKSGTCTWTQPIIDQPEIGYLGFITKIYDGTLKFLVQAKIEPGNINKVQLSPTLQATKSNYSLVHGGHAPDYLEYFENSTGSKVLVDQLQSEHNSRFYKKRNRNVIILVSNHIKLKSNFKWLTLGQLKTLLRFDNIVNMNARTILSCIPLLLKPCAQLVFHTYVTKSSLFNQSDFKLTGSSQNSLSDIHHFITNLKVRSLQNQDFIDLEDMPNWAISDRSIEDIHRQYFEILPIEVNIGTREVKSWCQPIINSFSYDLNVMLCKSFNGVLHFLMQAKFECGSFDILELGPSIQSSNPTKKTPYYSLFKSTSNTQVLYDTFQSEEGGRFFRESNRYVLLLMEESQEMELLNEFIWISAEQFCALAQFANLLNIQARTFLSLIDRT